MPSTSETGQSSEEVSQEAITISVNDIMKMKLEDIRTLVEKKKIDIKTLSKQMYDTAEQIDLYMKEGNQVSMKILMKKYTSAFEAILDGLLIGKKKTTWNSNDLIQFLTNKHLTQKFSVLYLAFRHKSAMIIRKLLELLTFDIKDNNKYDGVIVNGLTPMIDAICNDKTANTDMTEPQGVASTLSCLEWLVEDDNEEEEENAKIAEVMDIEPIRKIEEKVYNKMTTIVYMIVIVLHTLYMSLFSYSSMFLMDKIRNGTGIDSADQQTVIFYAVLPIEPIVFILCYAVGFRGRFKKCTNYRHRSLRYIVWKLSSMILRLVFTVLVIASMIQFALKEKIWVHNILSITVLAGWLTILTLTEGVTPLRVFWRMILQIIATDVYKIIFVYAFVLFSFSFALHIQFQLSQDLIDEYPTPFHTMFLVYELMLGNGELFNEEFQNNMKEGGGSEAMAKFLFVAYSVIATLVLMNLLIAMMNTSYYDVKQNLKLSRRIDSLERALAVEKMITNCPEFLRKFFRNTVFKDVINMGKLEENKIIKVTEPTSTENIIWFVKVARPMENEGKPAIKLIQELKSEINRKLDLLCEELTETGKLDLLCEEVTGTEKPDLPCEEVTEKIAGKQNNDSKA